MKAYSFSADKLNRLKGKLILSIHSYNQGWIGESGNRKFSQLTGFRVGCYIIMYLITKVNYIFVQHLQ